MSTHPPPPIVEAFVRAVRERTTEPAPVQDDRAVLVARLSAAGCVAAEEEADELLAAAATGASTAAPGHAGTAVPGSASAAAGSGDRELLGSLVRRRLAGEPLAWVTGRANFCGVAVRVDPGVYVPRWQSEPLARRAVDRLPARGLAVDLCTGSGAVARVLAEARPAARVVATDVDEQAVACATANGVEVYFGDLCSPLPPVLAGRVDVVVGVVPYVPTPALTLLPRDTLTFEPVRAYDGGHDGTDVLRRAVAGARRFLRPGGALLLELGGDQADLLAGDLARLGYVDVTVLADEDGDVRGIDATAGRRDRARGRRRS